MATATKQLIWSEGKQQYYFEYEDGRVLHVDGDAFAEARHDRVFAIMQDKNPGLDRNEINDLIANGLDGSDADNADTEVFNDLLDPDEWEGCALEVPAGLELEDVPCYYQYDAYIIQG